MLNQVGNAIIIHLYDCLLQVSISQLDLQFEIQKKTRFFKSNACVFNFYMYLTIIIYGINY